jgi:hypothetical protein
VIAETSGAATTIRPMPASISAKITTAVAPHRAADGPRLVIPGPAALPSRPNVSSSQTNRSAPGCQSAPPPQDAGFAFPSHLLPSS